MDRKAIGIKGEELARDYYKKRGYDVLETNYRFKRAEIDIIVLNESLGLLVFVEVKKRSRSDFGEAESFVSDSQQILIKEAAEEYIYGINWKKDIRFDIVAIDKKDRVEVFQDAF